MGVGMSPQYRTLGKPVIAVLLGDCTGIGPEITARLLAEGALNLAAHLIVIGDARVLVSGMRDADVSFTWRAIDQLRGFDWADAAVPIIDMANINPARLPRGEMSAESGRLTGETLAYAIKLAERGEIDGITFAPLNKAALHAGGWRFPDEHKMFAHLLGHKTYFAEMNVLDNQWMSRVTSHMSLREALDRIDETSISDAIKLSDAMMRRAGIAEPRIAVAALNPHAGEGGLFGREEIDLIAPAVQKTARLGINCRGPFPADTVYLKAFAGEFDGVVSMYHDQGQIATKMRGFNKGVTVTAGLEIVFTTPAHGTAFDIVGKGVANTGAMEKAIRLAATLAESNQRRSN
jgi:4-hydroxythreonine-4-phosphate dehydrogenase